MAELKLDTANILVTGGSGFIGSNLLLHLAETYPQATLVNFDKLTYAADNEHLATLAHNKSYHFIEGDICDAVLVGKVLRDHDINVIIHCAAESHVDRSISGPKVFIDTNIVGTFTLLEAARQWWQIENAWGSDHCRLHHISTDEVYGSLDMKDAPSTEDDRYRPSSPYSASKAASDHLVSAYSVTYGLPVTVSNCTNNYGPHQYPEKFIPIIINACLRGESIPIFGDGKNIRDWLYVKDHCRAITTILTSGKVGETYHVAGNNEVSNIDLVKHICVLMDDIVPDNAPHSALINFVDDRPGHDWRYALDCSKLRGTLGWKPQVNFEDGLLATIDYYSTG